MLCIWELHKNCAYIYLIFRNKIITSNIYDPEHIVFISLLNNSALYILYFFVLCMNKHAFCELMSYCLSSRPSLSLPKPISKIPMVLNFSFILLNDVILWMSLKSNKLFDNLQYKTIIYLQSMCQLWRQCANSGSGEGKVGEWTEKWPEIDTISAMISRAQLWRHWAQSAPLLYNFIVSPQYLWKWL